MFKYNIDADIPIVNSAAVPVTGVHERERAEIFALTSNIVYTRTH